MIMRKYNIECHEFLDAHLNRLSRYATQLERLISPEGNISRCRSFYVI